MAGQIVLKGTDERRHGRLVRLDGLGNGLGDSGHAVNPVPPAPSRWPPLTGARGEGALFLTPGLRLKATDSVSLNWRHPMALPAIVAMILMVPLLVIAALACKVWRVILYLRG